jgi:hypothetical protein
MRDAGLYGPLAHEHETRPDRRLDLWLLVIALLILAVVVLL